MKKESVDSKVFFYFASLLVTLNTQKNYTRLLAFAILNCICHVLNFNGWDSSQKVYAGHQQNGTLKTQGRLMKMLPPCAWKSVVTVATTD